MPDLYGNRGDKKAGRVEAASLMFQVVIAGFLAGLLFLVGNVISGQAKQLKMMAIVADRVSGKNPRMVILTSYDSASKLRTVRLDEKGRLVVSP